jgi:sugar phosphate permease
MSSPSSPSSAFLAGRIFLPFALGYYLSYLLRTVNAVISPDLTGELGLSAADLGLLTSTYFFAFGLAQIPVGIALDRFGPRRVEAVLLLITGLGAVLFATGDGLPTLASARGLIGLGVSACLMGGLKGFTLWFPREKLASMTGSCPCGALGAVTASAPLEALLPFIGWRGAFWAVAALSVGSAALIFFSMPDKDDGHGSGTLQEALRGVREVLVAREFWGFRGSRLSSPAASWRSRACGRCPG